MKIFSFLSMTKASLLICCLFSTGISDNISYSLYRVDDSRNNNVFTSSFAFAKTLFKQTMLLMDLELDQVTSPPITDGISGASRPAYAPHKSFKKNRGQVILGVQQGIGQNTTLTTNVYVSRETDYESQSITLSLTQELLQKNLTLNLRGQYNLDRVGYISKTQSYSDSVKEVASASVSLSQLLSPTTEISIGMDYSQLQGFLSDPYRNIDTDAKDTLPEVHPHYRFRYALCPGLRHYIPSIQFGFDLEYRFYFDQWEKEKLKGIESHTLSLRLKKYITENFILAPIYRYYSQTKAYFMKSRYSGEEQYYSADYKMRAFNSNNFGISADYFLRGAGNYSSALLFLENARLKAEYYRYFNTQDFWANMYQLTLSFEF